MLMIGVTLSITENLRPRLYKKLIRDTFKFLHINLLITDTRKKRERKISDIIILELTINASRIDRIRNKAKHNKNITMLLCLKMIYKLTLTNTKRRAILRANRTKGVSRLTFTLIAVILINRLVINVNNITAKIQRTIKSRIRRINTELSAYLITITIARNVIAFQPHLQSICSTETGNAKRATLSISINTESKLSRETSLRKRSRISKVITAKIALTQSISLNTITANQLRITRKYNRRITIMRHERQMRESSVIRRTFNISTLKNLPLQARITIESIVNLMIRQKSQRIKNINSFRSETRQIRNLKTKIIRKRATADLRNRQTQSGEILSLLRLQSARRINITIHRMCDNLLPTTIENPKRDKESLKMAFDTAIKIRGHRR